jgi:hypothetical protein
MVITTADLSVPFESYGPAAEQKKDSVVDGKVLALGATTIVTSALSAGYVVWLLRGGSLVASLMAVLPAWRTMDPLPILESFEESRRKDEGGETLASLAG